MVYIQRISLIERGRILIDIGFIKSYKRELAKMNNNKVGRPFLYPHSYVQFLAFLKIEFSISYRTVQGIVRGLGDYIKLDEIHFIFFSTKKTYQENVY